MKRLSFLSVLFLAVFAGCTKDDGSIKIVEDVCTQMDDNTFASYCRSEFDTDKDGKVSMQEASLVEYITIKEKGLSSLKGLQYFFNLKILDCSQNDLSSLDISGNVSLTNLNCSNNRLTALDPSKNIQLQSLFVSNNDITSLDVSNNRRLVYFSCGENRLSTLDISMLQWLQSLSYAYSFGYQKDGTITITDTKKHWGVPPSDDEEAGIKWNWK